MPSRHFRPKERFIIFGQLFIEHEEIDEVVASMKAGWLGTGPKVARFEKEFRTYKGSSHHGVSSPTAALHLAMRVPGLALTGHKGHHHPHDFSRHSQR